ncbi:Cell wall-associated hydrolase, NlpC family [Pseudobutyrivibrio ruminis]|uniref:Cell wall-associated hydrolase, NlpC family n=2 Tax=Pseudobutyrivibrio ruminis TaxID=46206 RepID=A0A1H7KN42_9FIRM|nr:SH3 domain-containing C40 family peptidase [Pseudobutyrivibrio ruminis]SEK87435.1 Cell wall-associated hydrolase, NlpC family [Pseudobutyrivibrio ruminis]SOC15119.1 Cell wall-associated hydrolase, NlpC family [Pseudobutyrivibrio ruminis DSM 9787]
MNSKMTKAVSYTLAACVVVSSLSFSASAATATSGVSALSSATGVLETTDYTAFAGAQLSVNDMIANANILAAESQLADNEASTVAASEENPYADIAIAQVDNYVYIRESASADSDYVGKLYNNSAATVSETVEAEDGTWLLITSGDVTGYVKSEYVVQGNQELAKEVSRRLATVKTTTLYVREEATTESDIIDLIPVGDDLTVIDESMADTGWVKVTCNAGEGYVSTDYVDLSTDFTVAESKNAEIARLAKEEEEKKAAQEAAKKATQAAAAVEKANSSSSSSSSKSYSAPSGSDGSSVVAYGSQFVGNPYVYGGSSLTNGTDCSGFVMSVYSAFGVSLPHSSSALRSAGYGVSYDEMQPGDIVCYSGHVGIYAGNGQLLHASTYRTGITYSNVNYKQILAIRRIF